MNNQDLIAQTLKYTASPNDVSAAALKVSEALGETDVNQIRIPGVLALALLNLERVVRRATVEQLKKDLGNVERHPRAEVPKELTQALKVLDNLCEEPSLAPALVGLREMIYAAKRAATEVVQRVRAERDAAEIERDKLSSFADTLAKKCDELAAENKGLHDAIEMMRAQLALHRNQ